MIQQDTNGGTTPDGNWASIAELNTNTGAISYYVRINGLPVITASNYATSERILREGANNPNTPAAQRALYAGALRTINEQQIRLQQSNRANQTATAEAENPGSVPATTRTEPIPPAATATAATGGQNTDTAAGQTSQNLKPDDGVQGTAVSGPGLASGTVTPPGGNKQTGDLAGAALSSSTVGDAALEMAGGLRGDGRPGSPGQSYSQPIGPPRLPDSTRINPLSQLSSYTYSIVLYMATPEAMNKFIQSGGVLGDLGAAGNGLYVIAQSGGINNQTQDRLVTSDGTIGAGAKKTGLDYYIDDLHIETFLPGGQNRQTVGTEIKFKVYEPYSYSFLTDVARAAIKLNNTSDIAKNQGPTLNGFQQHFIIGVKFYGYDAAGNLINSGDPRFRAYNNGGVGDNNAIISRYFCVKFTNIKFKLDGKMTVYSCETVIVSEQEAFNQTNGSVKMQYTLTGTTVADALIGGGSEGTSPNSNGLTTVLNKTLLDQLDRNLISIPNKYKIEFLDENNKPVSPRDSIIGRSRLIDAGTNPIQNAPLSSAKTTEQSTVAQTLNATSINTTARTLGITAGQTIVTVIDNIIAKSNYVTDALINTTTDSVEATTVAKPTNDTLRWYTINPVVNVIGTDPKTNTWTYDITYQIKPFNIPYIRTQLARKGRYPGAYKVYEYLFTGNNTEILSYEQQYDNLYYTIASDSTNPVEQPNPTGSSPRKIQNTQNSDPNSGKDNSGSRVNDEIRAQLYSPADQSLAKMRILGDPEFIMTTTGVNITTPSPYYGSDNSVNPHGGQVFIQITFKMPLDWNTAGEQAGLLDVTDRLQFYRTDRVLKSGIDGMIYRVLKVDSSFSRGLFSQTLDMIIVDEGELVIDGKKLSELDAEQENNREVERLRRRTSTSTTTSTTQPQNVAAGATSANAPSPTPSSTTETRNTETGPAPRRYNTGGRGSQIKRDSRSRGRTDIPNVQSPVNNTTGSSGVVIDDAAQPLPGP